MSRPRVVLIVQARMGSTRLPGKVLMDLQGAPMLQRQLERLERCESVDAIVVATSTSRSDDPIVDLADRLPGVAVFRGSEQDVLARYWHASRTHKADVVVRVTGDNPIVDPHLIDECTAVALTNPSVDYVGTSGYPVGVGAEVVAMRSLDRAYREAVTPEEREHVTLYIRRHPERFHSEFVGAQEDNSDIRLTVDELADLELIRSIYDALDTQSTTFGYRDVLRLFEQHPDLSKLNSHVLQVKPT